MDRSIIYVEQTEQQCTELHLSWDSGRYLAVVARYGTSEPLPDLLVRTSVPIEVLAAEKAAQQFRSATFQKFVDENLSLFQSGQWDDDLQQQANEMGE